MEISQRPSGNPGAAVDAGGSSLLVERGVQGRIESVKDGVAQVRLAPNVVVQARLDTAGTGMDVGAKVALWPNSDGTLTAKSVVSPTVDLQSEALQMLMDRLGSLLGDSTATALSKNLARGDLDGARKQIAELWQKVQTLPGDQVPADLKSWVEKAAPALLSRPGEAPVVPGGSVALALGLPTLVEGEYHATVAGQPSKLLGPTDLSPGSKGLWQSRVLPGGGAVWAPVGSVRSDSLRALPERIPANAEGAKTLLDWAGVEGTKEDLQSLGQWLDRTASDFQTASQAEEKRPTEALERQNLSASVLAGVAAEKPTIEPNLSPNLTSTATNAAGKEANSSSPSFVLNTPPAAELPKAVAERALVAWSLELPEHPLVRKAVLGEGPDLPGALQNLAKQILASPGAHPEWEKLLLDLGAKNWIPPQGSKAHEQNLSTRERLAEAVFEALSRTDASTPPPLREALQQTASALVKENLDPSRDPSREYPPAVFHAKSSDGSLEDGRIVVHDRRSKKRTDDPGVDHHTVEIEMRPTDLGPIKAKLELRGKVLTTRLEAREADTATILSAHADELREALQKIGLNPHPIVVERPKATGRIDPRKRGSGAALDLRV